MLRDKIPRVEGGIGGKDILVLRLSVTGKVNTLLGRFDHGEILRWLWPADVPGAQVSKGRNRWKRWSGSNRQRRQAETDGPRGQCDAYNALDCLARAKPLHEFD